MSLATDLTAISANNKAIIDNSNKAVELNNKLEQTLYGTDTGGKSYYDEFWDLYQDNGSRTHYMGAFAGIGWKEDMFFPKYKSIKVTNAYQMFAASRVATDLAELCRQRGITFDFSNCKRVTHMTMDNSYLTTFPECDFSGLTDLRYHFSGATKLHTIEKVKYPTGTNNNHTNAFQMCHSLKNIVIEGNISKSVSFQWSPLTHDSLMSIINALWDYSQAIVDERLLTLGASNIAKLTEDELNIIKAKGWEYA